MATVPSGLAHVPDEACELRDRDSKRFGGRGVLQAVANVNGPISHFLSGRSLDDPNELDRELIQFDGTPSKSRLGANSILGVSMAMRVAAAQSRSISLHRMLSHDEPIRIPVPMVNILNGGIHADTRLRVQEVMVVPVGAKDFHEAIRMSVEIFYALKEDLRSRSLGTGVGDEGGFAPNLANPESALEIVTEAIVHAGFTPGAEISVAIDMAADWLGTSELGYDLGNGPIDRDSLLKLYEKWADAYPLVAIEDGFAYEDVDGFRDLFESLGHRMLVVGDDLFTTNPVRLDDQNLLGAANAAIIKLNQIGTVTEAIDAVDVCRAKRMATIVSHRSGDSEDTFIADFAVAMRSEFIKTGSVTRSERTAKYNRLLEIESDASNHASFGLSLTDLYSNQ